MPSVNDAAFTDTEMAGTHRTSSGSRVSRAEARRIGALLDFLNVRFSQCRQSLNIMVWAPAGAGKMVPTDG